MEKTTIQISTQLRDNLRRALRRLPSGELEDYEELLTRWWRREEALAKEAQRR